MRVLVTGSQGFIGSYLCKELLDQGYKVIGVDNYSKYGELVRPHDNHPNFTFYNEDISRWRHDNVASHPALEHIDFIIAGAAMIGGISYFHKYAYDLLANNERILANTFDLGIKLFNNNRLKRIIVLSSSMVFENTELYPTPESQILSCPPPSSTYGFQKLASEYFAKGAFEQHGLPYSIVRPFNCVGVGEDKALGESEVTSGNVKLMLSHVLPDIINKTLMGQDPLHILGEGNQVRCYTNGRDIARGIRLVMESDKAVNEDFNISTPIGTTVLELAECVWEYLNPDKPFRYESDEPFLYDVQKRVPDTTKAKEVLGFEAKITLEESVEEVAEWMKAQNAVAV